MSDERKGCPSASSFERLMDCPGSHTLNKEAPKQPSSPGAARGTRVHAGCSGDVAIASLPRDEQQTVTELLQQEEILLNEFTNPASFGLGWGVEEQLTEKRFWAKATESEWSGKADRVYLLQKGKEKIGLVVDFKSTRYTTGAEKSLQLAALVALVDAHYKRDLSGVHVALVFPDGYDRAYYDDEALELAADECKQLVDKATITSTQKRTPSESACKWCGAKGICPEARGQLNELNERRERNEEVIGVMLGLEGAHVLRGSLDVPWLAAHGFRVVGITHFNDNQFGDSAHGLRRGGLKPAGRELVLQLDSHSIIIDLAHASAALIDDVLEMSGQGKIIRPLIVSHTGIKGVHYHRRNISDSHAVAIAATGGLIGITLFAPGLPRADLAALGESISYTVKLLDDAGLEGARHVAIGSDFDGAVRTIVDTAGWQRITEELLKPVHGLDPEQVEWIVGGNIRNFFAENLPA